MGDRQQADRWDTVGGKEEARRGRTDGPLTRWGGPRRSSDGVPANLEDGVEEEVISIYD